MLRALVPATLLAVLLAVAGCGAQQVTAAAARPDPLAMVGWWKVEGTDQVALFDPASVEVRDGCRTLDGSWRADPGGNFLAEVFSESPCPGQEAPTITPPEWLARASGFAVEGTERVIRDGSGTQIARLVPQAPGPVAGATDPSRAATDAERAAVGAAAPVPAGMRAVGRDQLVGKWVPAGFTGATRPSAGFTADGRWTGSDGCNGTGGGWTIGTDGAFLATSGVSTLIGCAGVDVGTQVSGARRVAFEGDTLVFLDAAGQATGRFTKA